MKFQDKDELRQQLLELHYDLLDSDKATQLRHAIETDPDVAFEWASTLRVAGQFSDAAKLQDATEFQQVAQPKSRLLESSESVTPSQDGIAPTNQPGSIKEASANHVVKEGSATGWLRSTAIAATAAMIGMLVLGFGYLGRIPDAPHAVVAVKGETGSRGFCDDGQCVPFCHHTDERGTVIRERFFGCACVPLVRRDLPEFDPLLRFNADRRKRVGHHSVAR